MRAVGLPLELEQEMELFLDGTSENIISEERALTRELGGMGMFRRPIWGYSSARDPMYEAMKEPRAVGECFMLPEEWLPGARTVISFFLPFTSELAETNLADPLEPSPGWLHGRKEGQEMVELFSGRLCRYLQERGFEAVSPCLDPRFASIREEHSNPRFPAGTSFTSNWSERHVAYISGLGTFGLSKGLITRAGICGRFGSVVTTAEMPVTPRPYTSLNEYCAHCGACIDRCPAGAITFEKGKSHARCLAYTLPMEEKYRPRFGCGKCQVGVPCQYGIPLRGTKS